jgi:hypothetical protein
MVSRIDIGPSGGPYVEIDESNGDLVVRTPNDNVDFNDEALINIASVAVDSLSTNNDAAIDFNSEDVSNIGTLEAGGINFIGSFATKSDFDSAANVEDIGFVEDKNTLVVKEN